jgi:Zn-dependent protease/predicted transcriptional regulator
MFGRSFQIARIGGISIEVHPSWFLILALISYTLADGWFPAQYSSWSTAAYWAVGIVAALLLFVTVLVHELAHAAVAIHRGLAVPKITLFIFGGVSQLAGQPRSPGEEFQISAAGPGASIVIAIVAGGAALALSSSNEKVDGILWYLATVNLLLGVFNVLPGFPLDGGRVLRSIAWERTHSFRRATRIAGGVGEIFGYGLMILGLVFLLGGFVFDALWFLFVGWFLHGAARGESQNLQLETILAGLSARDVMHTDFPTARPGDSVQHVVDEQMIGRGEHAVMVSNDDAVLGMVTVHDVHKVPRDHWLQTPVQSVMTPRQGLITVSAERKALDVMMLLAEKRLDQVAVLEDGRMVGLITRRELLDQIHLAEELGPKPGEAAGAAPNVDRTA